MADLYHDILKKLDVREKEEGNLPLLLEFYRALLVIQSNTKKRLGVSEAGLSKKDIDERIRNGLPLLRFENLDLDWGLLEETFAKVVAAYHAYPELFGDMPEDSVPRLTKELVKAWYEGGEIPEPVSAASQRLVRAMLQATMNPFLRSYSQVLIGSFDIEFWRRRYCPVCGGSPDFSFLDKERGSRWLVCSRCDTEWVFQRLECPFCGTQNQNSLVLFTDEEELYRLHVCEQCKCYLKTIDLRKTEDEALLPLERFNTIDLDLQAKEYGYSPCRKPISNKR
jgi:FdhE protein